MGRASNQAKKKRDQAKAQILDGKFSSSATLEKHRELFDDEVDDYEFDEVFVEC